MSGERTLFNPDASLRRRIQKWQWLSLPAKIPIDYTDHDGASLNMADGYWLFRRGPSSGLCSGYDCGD
jgi:hypothetical protein